MREASKDRFRLHMRETLLLESNTLVHGALQLTHNYLMRFHSLRALM